MDKNIIAILLFVFVLSGCTTTKWTGEESTEKTKVVKTWLEQSLYSFSRWKYSYYMTLKGDGRLGDTRYVVKISKNFYGKIILGDMVILSWHQLDDGSWKINSYYREDY
ncbi:hypothetical protein FACS1894130_04880 [Spirochaetia bacterium]|nr:hypothetical protein FACS1894130_04880 [Spirochaetia bacterium]